jgi:hypothetical protein
MHYPYIVPLYAVSQITPRGCRLGLPGSSVVQLEEFTLARLAQHWLALLFNGILTKDKIGRWNKKGKKEAPKNRNLRREMRGKGGAALRGSNTMSTPISLPARAAKRSLNHALLYTNT